MALWIYDWFFMRFYSLIYYFFNRKICMTNNEWEKQFDEIFPLEALHPDLPGKNLFKEELKQFIAQTRQDTVREVIEIANNRMLEEKPFSSNPSESIHPSIYNKALTHLISQLREEYGIKE